MTDALPRESGTRGSKKRYRLQRDEARFEAEFWKRRYDEQHRTLHSCEDALAEARAAATEIAKAARQLVNAGLPPDLDLERPFWVAARNVRATLGTYADLTGIDGEQDRQPGEDEQHG